MKTIHVVAAIIRSGDKIYATQRGYGEFEGGWEFPGGKIEPGETPQEALIREIKEELTVDIEVDGVKSAFADKLKSRLGIVVIEPTRVTRLQS